MQPGYLAATVGGVVLILLITWFGTRTIGVEVLHAGWAIPAIVALHLLQLFLSTCAWRRVGGRSLTRRSLFRLRVIREGVNSLLPVAQRSGLFRVIEWQAANLQRVWPAISVDSGAGASTWGTVHSVSTLTRLPVGSAKCTM